MKRYILQIIDSPYFLFEKFFNLKTYRYAVCGGSNLVLDTILYFLTYNFILLKQNLDLHFFVLSPHIASLFFVFPVTFFTGFLLSRYITFRDSSLSGKVQFLRYLIVAFGAIMLSYGAIKFFVDFLKFYPTPSRLLTIIITVLYSYVLQNNFSFRAD